MSRKRQFDREIAADSAGTKDTRATEGVAFDQRIKVEQARAA